MAFFPGARAVGTALIIIGAALGGSTLVPGCSFDAGGTPQTVCPPGQPYCQVHLTLLHTADIHSRLFDYDLLIEQTDAELGLGTLVSGARYRWLALFPLIAAQLQSGNPAAAIAAAREIVDPAQQLLPDELMAALDAALDAWDGGKAVAAEELLASALRLAHELHFF